MVDANIDFRSTFYSLPTPYMMLNRELCFIDMNDRYLEVTERTRDDLLGRYVFDAFPEAQERLTMFKRAFERAVAGKANSLIKKPFSIPRPAEQGGGFKEVWWTCHHVPIYDMERKLCGMVQQALDVTAEVIAERMRDVISHEFDHRVKNLLSKISAIASMTARTAASTDTFIPAFEARLRAMGRTHELLVDDGWEGLPLSVLFENELQPFHDAGDPRVVISGPHVVFTAAQIQVLGMAVHELATNAAKYGALSHPDGRLEISWAADPVTRGLEIVWSESGLQGVEAPKVSGFGSTIIDKVMPAELSAVVERKFLPTGLRCAISIPRETLRG